jgi:single-strand DNA-binding protein
VSSINKVILIGRVGKNPEVKHTASGTAVCRFSVATNEKWKDNGGKDQERTEWHSIVAFAKTGELCSEYLAKGKLCYVEGSIRSSQWEDRDGNRRKSFDIVAQRMRVLSPPTNGNSAKANNSPSAQAPRPEEDDNPFREDEASAEDVPF